MFISSWRKLVEQVRKNSRGGRRPRLEARKFSGLFLEQLEDRTLLSTFQWTGQGSDTTWSNPGNWAQNGVPASSFPNAVGDIAQFVGTIPGSSTVMLNQAITVGEIDFAATSGITITPSSTGILTFDNTGFAGNSILSVSPASSGIDLINAPLRAVNTSFVANIAGGTLQLNNSGSPANSFGSSSTFLVDGGTLSITGSNNTGVAGVTVTSGGTLAVSGNGTINGTTANPNSLTVFTGGTIQVNDNAGTSITNRLGANTNLVLDGGTFSYIGANNSSSTDSLGTITVNRGSSTFLTTSTGATGSVALTANNLARNPGSTVTFNGSSSATLLQNLDTSANKITFNTAPTTIGNNGGILPYAVVVNNDFGDFATYDTANSSLAAFTGYVGSIAVAGPGDIVKENGSETLTSSKTITGLLLTGAGAVAEAGNTLTIASGGILNTSTTGGTIAGGTLAFGGTGEGIVTTAQVGGVTASFYNNGFRLLNGVPVTNQINFNMTPTASRVDPSINYPENANGLQGAGGGGPVVALPATVQTNNIAAQWNGVLNVVTGGSYTFSMLIFDEASMFIDGNPVWFVLGNGGGAAPGSASLPITLTPGLHTFKELFNHNQGSGTNVISYNGPDTNNLTVLITAASSPTKPGFLTSATTTLNSALAAGASLTVGGGGTLTLPTANTYSGTTTLAGGTLTVGNNSSFGTGTLNLVAGTLTASAAVTLANPLALTDSQTTIAGINNITFNGPGTLSDTGIGTGVLTNTLTVSNQGQTNFAGALSGGGSLTLPGTAAGSSPIQGVLPTIGNVILGGVNTYSGGTVLAGGSLILASSSSGTASGPVGQGTLTLAGGTLMADASARTVNNALTLAGNVTLAGSSFGGTTAANSSLTFTGATAVTANSALTIPGTVTLGGNLSGTGQLSVLGTGSLTLTGAGSSSFSGGVVLNAGSLGAFGTLTIANNNSLGSGPLTLSDGTLQASAAGVTLANQVTFTDGSFIAFGGANGITFANAAPTNNLNNVLAGTANLIVNVPTTFNEVLGGSGVTGGNLNLYSGSSTLTLTGANTFFGTTTVNGGTLVLSGANGSLLGTNAVTVNTGGTLALVNTALANNTGRLPAGLALTMNGGTLSLTGGNGVASSQTLGSVNVQGGNSTILVAVGTGLQSSVVLAGGALFETGGATVNFQAATGILGTAAIEITFNFAPLVGSGTQIIQAATVTDATTFAGNTSGYNLAILGGNGVAALTSYVPLSASGGNNANAGDNVLVTAPVALTASDAVNAILLIGSGANITGASGKILTVAGGMVASNAASAAGSNAISVPTLAFGSAEGSLFTNTGSLAVSSTITGTGGLVIAGPGTLTLPTANTYTNANAQPEVQSILITGLPTGGTFALSFNGAVTVAIAYTATNITLQNALQALGTIGAGNVMVTSPAFESYTVLFTGALAGADQPQLVLATNSLTGGTAPTVQINTTSHGSSTTFLDGSGTLILGTNGAVQGGLTVTSGTLQATGAITLPNGIAFGAPANGLSNGGSGSSAVTISGSSPLIVGGSVDLNGLSAQITVSNTAPTIISGVVANGPSGGNTTLIKQGTGTLTLTGVNTYTGVTWIQSGGAVNIQNNASLGASGNAVQTLSFTNGVAGGTFTLSFGGATTGPITWAVDPTQMTSNIQFALDTLSTVGLNATAVANLGTNGFGPFSLTFQNLLGATNVPVLGVNSTNLTGGTASVSLTTTGSASGTVVSAGATLQIQGNIASVQERLTVGGSGAATAALLNVAGSNTLAGAITMTSGTTVGGDVGTLTLGGLIAGSADLTKVGGGTVLLGGDSTFTGQTNINAGVVITNDPTALGSNAGGTTVLSGASLELGKGPGTGITSGATVSRVGIVAGEALTLSGTGLGLTNSNLGLVGPTGALEANSNTSLTWTGNITLASDTTINSNVIETAADAQSTLTPGPLGVLQAIFTITGNISGAGGLIKTGSAPVTLLGANTYAGLTTVLVGPLTLAGSGTLYQGSGVQVPGTSAVQTITLGGTVTGGSFALSFNNSTTGAIAWNSVGSVLAGTIQTALNALSSIGAGNTVVTGTGPFTITFQNVLGKTNVPTLTAASSLLGTSPTVTVANTTTGASSVTVRIGAAFGLDNTAANLPDRLNDAATIGLYGGTFSYIGNSAAGAASTETVGALTLGTGFNTVVIQSGSGAGSSAIVTSAGLFRVAGATVNFNGNTSPLGSATAQIIFTSAPLLMGKSGTSSDSIIPFATVQAPGTTSLNFATYGASGVLGFTNYVTSLANAQPTDNVELTASTTLSSNKVVNSLLLAGSLTLTEGAGGNSFDLTVASGGLLVASGTATITGGTLDFGTAEGIVIAGGSVVPVTTSGISPETSTADGASAVTNGVTLTVNSVVTGSNGLTISGAGVVTLNGTGFYTGTTTYNGGGLNESAFATGQLALGSLGALGNTSLTAICGTIGPTFGANFTVLTSPITLNNSIVGFGLGGGNRTTFSGPFTLIGNDTITALSVSTYIAGAIGGAGSLTIGDTAYPGLGSGGTAIILEGNNTYTGGTNLDPFNLPGNSPDEVLVDSSNAFGTGPINWLGGQIDQARNLAGPTVEAGVAAVSFSNQINFANSSVTIAAGGSLTTFGGNGSITFTGPVTTNGSNTVTVLANQNADFTNQISGAGSLTVAPAGTGTVELAGANSLTGGVNLSGTGTLILGNSLALGTGPYVQNGGTLQDDGIHQITIANPLQIDVGTIPRTISATNPTLPFTITGIVSATAGLATASQAFVKGGAGNLVFTSPINVDNTVTVNQGTMTLQGGGSVFATSLTVNAGATLVVDNTGTNNDNRISDLMPVTLAGGKIDYRGTNSAGGLSSEFIGNVTLNAGNDVISSTSGTGTGAASALTIGNLTRNAGAVISFAGGGTALGSATNQIVIDNLASGVTQVNSYTGGVLSGNAFILPFATVTGPTAGSLDFAAVGSAAPFSVSPFTGYATAGLGVSGPSDVVKLTAGDPVSGFDSAAGLLISGNGLTVGGGGGSLTLGTGELLVAGSTAGAADVVSAPLSLNNEGILVSNFNPGLTLSGGIGGGSGLTIGGPGTVNLGTTDSYSGTTTLTSGNLIVGTTGSASTITPIPGALTVTGGTLQSGSSSGITIGGTVALSIPAGAFTFAGSNPLTLSGVISGTGGTTINAPGGALIYSGGTANTYTGTTTVSAGALLLSKSAGAGLAGPVVITGGTVQETTNINQLNSQLVTLSATNAVQTLTFSTSPAPTGGNFTLIFNGATTGSIAFSSVASQLQSNIQSALNALSTVGAGNSIVPLPSGNTVLIVFQGALGGAAQSTMSSGGTLTPSGATVAAATTTAGTSGTLALGANPATIGTLMFINGGAVTMTTGTLSFATANDASIQTVSNPLNPANPVSTSNPVSPSTAIISGGTVNLWAVSSNINVSNSGGTFSSPSQSISFPGVTGGTFTLTFGGLTTPALSYSSAAATLASTIANALNGLTSVAALGSAAAPGTVSVTGTTVAGAVTESITFNSATPGTFVPLVTATVAVSANPTQTVNLPAGTTGGTFTLVYNGATTVPIAYSATSTALASNVQSALNALSSLSAANAIQTLTFATSPTGGTVNGGTFSLKFGTQVTGNITYTTFLATLEANVLNALNALSTINSVTVNGSPVATNSANVAIGGSAAALTVTFQNALGGAPQALLSVPSNNLTATSGTATLTVTTSTSGLASTANSTLVSAPGATTISVLFQNNLGGGVVPLTLSGAGLASNAVQQISFATITGGTFSLSFNGASTAPIVFSATASVLATNISNALNALATIGAIGGSVTVAGSGNPIVETVTFGGALANSAQSSVITATATPLVSTVETITFPSGLTGGTFTLTFNGGTTAAINYSSVATSLASNIQAALNVTTAIGAGNTSVVAASATSVTVTFTGTLGGGVIQTVGSGNGTSVLAVAPTSAVQTISFPASAQNGGTFTLSFLKGTTQTTLPITYSTNPTTLAGNIQSALTTAAFTNIGAGNVVVTANSTATIATVTFQGTLANQALNTLAANGVAVNAVQSLTFNPAPTSGTFTLTYGTATTGPISYSSVVGTLQANIQNALDGLASVGAGNTSVIATSATSVNVTFQNALGAAPQSPGLSASAGGLLPATAAIVVATTTAGFAGLNGGSPTVVTATAGSAGSAAGLTGLLGGSGSQTISVAIATTGFGLNPPAGATPTSAAIIAGGQGGLSGGGTTLLIAGSSGFGLTGTSPIANIVTTNPGFAGDLVITSSIGPAGSGFGLTKIGGGTLTVAGSGANTYNGATSVNEGTVVFAKQAAVAAVAAQVIVGDFNGAQTVRVGSNFAQLNTQNIYVTTSGTLDLSSATTAGQSIGSLDIRGGTVLTGSNVLTLGGNLSGVAIGTQSASLSGKLDLGGSSPTITVSDNGSTLGFNLSAVISSASGAFGFTKLGAGTLNLNGSAANTYTGTTNVNEGTLLLNDSGGVAVPGTLVVGDGAGGSGVTKADVVRLGRATQIATAAAVTVNNSGLLDLNTFTNTIASLTLSGGTVTTETGTLTLGGNVTGTASPANLTPATITGNLALGTTTRFFDVTQGTLTTTVTVNGSPATVPLPDMVVNAVISGTGGLTKSSDAGTLQLLAANTYTGPTTVVVGNLIVNGSLVGTSTVTLSGGTLGGTGTTGPVVVNAGGSINPGDPALGSPGILTNNGPSSVAATTDLSGGGNLTLQIGGFTGAGTTYSQLKLTGLGILKLSSTSTLTLNLAGLSGDGIATAVILYNGLVGGTFLKQNISTINNPNNLQPVLNYLPGELDISFAGPAASFNISSGLAGSATAGTAFTTTVTALDQFGKPALSYTGTVHFTKTDSGAGSFVPANYTFTTGTGADNGVHVFTNGTKLVTAGIQTITGTDTSTGGVTGNLAITVVASTATHFAVAAQASLQAGQFAVFSVTALDQFNNVATGYTGTVHFTSSDSQAGLANDATLTNGIGFFAFTLRTAGSQTITATDTSSGSITGVSGNIAVSAGALNHFGITASASAVPGISFPLTVTAQDQFNNTVTSYNGTVHFANITNATLPGNTTLTAGSGSFNATLTIAGNQAITVSDTVTTTITGSTTVTVNATAVTHFAVNSSATSTPAGSIIVFTVTAEDGFNNPVANYPGIVHFTSNDSQATLPADTTLSGGTGFFGASLKTAGNDTITATDTASASITGTSAVDAVTGLAVNHFVVTGPLTGAITGNQFGFAVKAEDPFGNVNAGYSGTVHFTSSDPSAVLPGNTTLTAGQGTFNATFKTPGAQTITAADTLTPAITGTSNNIATVGLIVSSFTVTSTGFTVVFNKPFNLSQINLYDTAGAYGSDDVTLTGPLSPQTSFRGSLMVDPTNTTITFVKTSTFNGINFSPSTGVLAPGTYTATLRSASNGFEDTLGGLLDGTGTGNGPGTSYTTTFVVGATPAVVGIPAFARGPDSKDVINLPNNVANSGIPINISNGIGVTSGQFTLQYNPAYLSITAATVNSGLTGASLSLDASSTAGNAVIDFSTTSALTTSVAHLGSLVGTVPNSAAPFYTLKALMHFSSVQLSGASGAITGIGDDALDVAAYFGDANGDGTFSGGDASTISRVSSGTDNNPATGTIGGFSSFRLSDPAIVGDLNTNGTVDAPDVTLINSFLAGTPRSQLPADNPNSLTIPSNGPDPSLSLPTTLQASPGSTVVVPVNIDTARPDGSTGMTEAILGLKYDPQVFSVSAADVSLGSLPETTSGWQLSTVVNAQTGEIAIDLYGGSAIQTTAAGSLVTITLHMRETAPVGGTGLTLVNQVNPTGQRDFTTTVEDAQGAFTLHPVAADEAGTAGLVTVNAPVLPQSFVMSSTNAPASAPASTFGVQDGSSMAASALPLGLVEQVFGSMEQTLVQEGAFVQPNAILTPELNQTGNGSTDQTLMQQVGVAQHDWVPAEMLAHLGQTAKAGHRSPIEDILGGPGRDETGVEEFIAREAAPKGS